MGANCTLRSGASTPAVMAWLATAADAATVLTFGAPPVLLHAHTPWRWLLGETGGLGDGYGGEKRRGEERGAYEREARSEK